MNDAMPTIGNQYRANPTLKTRNDFGMREHETTKQDAAQTSILVVNEISARDAPGNLDRGLNSYSVRKRTIP